MSRKLSIVVPVYNMAADNKLRFCLDSLVNQTIADYEIIAVDDASTDESFQILKEYESKYPWKFKAVQSFENKKQGGARNKGIELANSTWIGFVDSDDWVALDMYEKLIKKAERTGADVVGCDYCMTTQQSMRVGKLMPNNTMDQTGILDCEKYRKLVMNPGSMVIKVYQKSVIDKNHLRFPEKRFMRITVPLQYGCFILNTLRRWRNHCTIIFSMRLPLCMKSVWKNAWQDYLWVKSLSKKAADMDFISCISRNLSLLFQSYII